MKIKFHIREGRYTFTGSRVSGWTVNGHGQPTKYFAALKEAKDFAIQAYAASGKWKAESRPTGVRGKMERHYFDAMEEVDE